MTLQEKIGQMIQIDRGFIQKKEDITDYFIGSILSGGGSVPSSNEPTAWADMVDEYQTYALKTRLQIPLIYGCLLYTSPSPRDLSTSRMPSSA